MRPTTHPSTNAHNSLVEPSSVLRLQASVILHPLAFILFFISLAPLTSRALTEGNYTYTTNALGQATITRFSTSYSGSLSIPNTLGGGPVTSIGNFAFQYCTGLTSVTIPNSVTSIGDGAFFGCLVMASVTIPNSVTSIGTNAFQYCWFLASVTIPGSVTAIGADAFAFCSNLKGVIIGDGVTSIDTFTFSCCTSLTNVVIGASVTSIGDNAFQDCWLLASVTIPDSVTNIGNSAFQACTDLTSVTIPRHVTNIGLGAFKACSHLNTILVDTNNPCYSSEAGVLFNKTQTALITYPGGKPGNYTTPEAVTAICSVAFSSCTGLTSITIHANVTDIHDYAFFVDCNVLTSINVNADNPFYSSKDGILFNKTRTTLLSYPGGLTGSFSIPDDVTSINNNAFPGCTGLTSITISDSITNIGKFAFQYCTGLTSVTIPDTIDAINAGAFYRCRNLTNIVIGASVTDIGENAFVGCSSLISVNIPEGVTAIGQSAFYGCTSLTSSTIPGSVTSIGTWAFEYCTALTNIFFKGNAPTLGSSVFSSTPATIYYLPGTTGWGTSYGGRPTLLWNPTVQCDATFGFASDRFGFNIAGTTNIPVVVQATTNLATGVWMPLLTNTLGASGSLYFTDPSSTNMPARFYRIVWP